MRCCDSLKWMTKPTGLYTFTPKSLGSPMTTQLARPLEGTRLIDLTHMLAGPYAGMILADLGCDTVKVEPPNGESTRRLLESDPKYSYKGMGAYFLTLNRNKRSVVIDLKSADGRRYFFALIQSADVVLDNFAAGVTKRLQIDHETLSKVNPRLVTCSISGFGGDGPRYNRPAFDQIIQGLGGGMSITGSGPGEFVRAGIPIADLAGGMFAVMGIQAALLARQQTGTGQHVDISMLDAQVSMLSYMATMYTLSGEVPGPIGNSHFVHTPYNTFETADETITIAVVTDASWDAMVEALHIEELRDPKLRTGPARLVRQAEIESVIQQRLKTASAEHWLAKLEAARVPCARVNNFAQALVDPQIQHRHMVVEIEHPEGGTVEVPGNPIKLSETEAEVFAPPPLLGAHTREVFTSWTDMSEDELARGFDAGAIG